jgi:2-keto-4-pentenoate hydratase
MTERLGACVENQRSPSPGCQGGQWIADEATGLLAAERSRNPVAPLTARRPGLSLQDAYRIQAAGVACRVAAGARVVGHKVGVTSKAMQQQMRADEPDSGVLLDHMVLPSGSELLMGDFMNPRVEAEIAFRLGRDLRGPDVDVEDARRVVSDVFLALEVIDTRFTDWQIALADSVAGQRVLRAGRHGGHGLARSRLGPRCRAAGRERRRHSRRPGGRPGRPW